MPLFVRRGTAVSAALPACLALTTLLSIAGPAAAAPADCSGAERLRPATLTVRLDNDLLGGRDEGYTNGALLTLASPNLGSFTDDDCLPAPVRALNRGLRWLQPGDAVQRNMVFGIGQAILTPRDNERSDPILDDRPYAAVLALGMAWQGRRGDLLESTSLRLGIVGPSARGEEVQRVVHRITDSRRFNGWRNQLHDEPVFQLQREWARRGPASATAGGDSAGWDTITHWGASLGNLQTGAVAGAQWRWGTRLPDDFGSHPQWAGGDGNAPARRATGRRDGWSGHVFTAADLRWSLYNVTLDGNTWRDSQSVERRALVGELSYGVVIDGGPWKFALARYHRSREFVGQRSRAVFGSITVSRAL